MQLCQVNKTGQYMSVIQVSKFTYTSTNLSPSSAKTMNTKNMSGDSCIMESVKAVTLIFISGRGSAISSAQKGKSGYIYW